jgi:pimeloyl-ACP methyl ester carboxylesterase
VTAALSIGIERRGSGPPLLLLPGDDGLLFSDGFATALAKEHDVAVAQCPGWGDTPLPVWLRSVDELSYLYLDAIERTFGGAAVPAVGVAFGAWVLLEAATKSPGSFSSIVLVSPVGVKLSARDQRQFADLFAANLDERARLLYADPASAPDFASLDDDVMRSVARAQEGLARFGWEPYLHSPGLRHRLHRVRCPVLIVRGSDDRFVQTAGYHDQLAAHFDRAEVVTIAGGGHRVEEEQPERVADAVVGFIASGS